MAYQKGHIGYNKGAKLSGEWRSCLRCSKKVWFTTSRIIGGGGKYCSMICSNISTAKRGKDSYAWKKKVGYYGVHSWLYTNYGSPKNCENCGKEGSKNKGNKWNIQWALIKSKKYERVRENFMALCSKCHMHYDDTIPYVSKGRKWSDEMKQKISKATRLGMFKAGYNIKL